MKPRNLGETEALGKQFIESVLRKHGLKTESVTGIHIGLQAGGLVHITVDLVPLHLAASEISVT